MHRFVLYVLFVVSGVVHAADAPAPSKREIIKQCSPAVVHLYCLSRNPATSQLESRSLGTAFVVAKGGIIATCQHVIVEVPTGAQIAAFPGDTHKVNFVESAATVLKNDAEHDLVLLSCPALADVTPLTLDTTGDVQAGDDLLLMGYPLKDHTLTSRRFMIAATGDFPLAGTATTATQLKLDGTVNNGDSGAPLISLSTGFVVGVARTKVSFILPNVPTTATRAGDVQAVDLLVEDLRKESNVGLSYALHSKYLQALSGAK